MTDHGQDHHYTEANCDFSDQSDRVAEITLEQVPNKIMDYFPTVPIELKPLVGMEFESDKVAYDFYNAYARASGFSIRRDRSWFKKDGLHYRQFVCSKQGYRKDSKHDKDGNRKARAITRCGCKAYIEFKIKDMIYKVNKFVEGHNHILHSPSKAHLLRSSKYMDEITKSRIKNLSTTDSQPTLLAHSLVEKQLVGVLTRKMFFKFQEQLLAIGGCSTRSIQFDGNVKKYEITHDLTKKDYIVSYVQSNCTVHCSCQKFDFEGIVCQHMFFVLRLENILELPPQYILKRWRKDARSLHAHASHGIELNANSQNSMTDRYNHLMFLANKCATDGAMYEHSYGRVKDILTKASLEIENINKEELAESKKNEAEGFKEAVDNVTSENYGSQCHQFVASQCGSTNSITVLDPKLVRAKGIGKRIGRACRSCQGIGHDSRNCPKNKKKRTSNMKSS